MRGLGRGSPDYGLGDENEGSRSSNRGASPGWDSSKRKRSTSPPDRSVRARYDGHGSGGRGTYSRTGLVNPANRDTLVSFRQYSEWFRQTHPDEYNNEATPNASDDDLDSSLHKRYEEYRRTFVNKQYRLMFDFHRTSAWFLDKYDTSERYVDMRERVRQEGWKDTIEQFVIELEAGKFDPPLPGRESAGPMELSRGETDEAPDDSSTLKGISAKPLVAGEHMVSPRHPQLMIRTLPPDIGRLKLEELLAKLSGFKYVAIGDPVQKRSFYRSAWIAFEFEEDAKKALAELESKKIQNFRLSVTHTSEPFIAKTRNAPAGASSLSRMEKDLDQAKRLVKVFEARATDLSRYKPLFAVGTDQGVLTPTRSKSPLEPETPLGATQGDPSRGSAAVETRIDKLAWETLDTDEDGNLDRAKHVGTIYPVSLASLKRRKVALSLDIYLAYLREAFNCCYYCGVVADHSEELVRKCIKHERCEAADAAAVPEEGLNGQEAADLTMDERWGVSLDRKIACLIDPKAVDPTVYGGTTLEAEHTRITAPHFFEEGEGRWRCRQCDKVFKAEEFIGRHVANKHAELLQSQLHDWELFNKFILDPQHIVPMQAVPQTSGPAQLPPQAYGLPPDWRPSHGDSLRSDRGARDRRPPYGTRNGVPRSISPMQFGKPMRFTMDSIGLGNSPGGRNRHTDILPMSSSLPAIPGLPAKPVYAVSTTVSTPSISTPPFLERVKPPPPPGQKADPRARVNYQDLDMVDGADDVALQY